MKRSTPKLAAGLALLCVLSTTPLGFADPRVIVSAIADSAYTKRKFESGKIRPESYVVMTGHFFEGNSVDKSIDRMPFRRIAEVFAPELAKREYWPAKTIKEADLLIVVHWGTTTPQLTTMEMRGRTSTTDTSQTDAIRKMQIDVAVASLTPEPGHAPADALSVAMTVAVLEQADEGARQHEMDALEHLVDKASDEYSSANIAQLLGYTRDLRKYGQTTAVSPAEEYTLRSDLHQPRYFIILKAYDLRAGSPAARSKSIWTLHLNMSSPGNNFRGALDRMSEAAVNFVGRTTDSVETLMPSPRTGKVDVGAPVIVEDKKR